MEKLSFFKEEERVRQDFLSLRIFLEEGERLESLRDHEDLWIEALPAQGL